MVWEGETRSFAGMGVRHCSSWHVSGKWACPVLIRHLSVGRAKRCNKKRRWGAYLRSASLAFPYYTQPHFFRVKGRVSGDGGEDFTSWLHKSRSLSSFGLTDSLFIMSPIRHSEWKAERKSLSSRSMVWIPSMPMNDHENTSFISTLTPRTLLPSCSMDTNSENTSSHYPLETESLATAYMMSDAFIVFA